MAGRMTEEQITKALLKWLDRHGWEILCFDFPQSGTGYVLHPDEAIRTTKNKGAIIPDIVAIRENVCLFFENKDRFAKSDFEKINALRTESQYLVSIERLLFGRKISRIFYGVGLPNTTSIAAKTLTFNHMIDFALFVDQENRNVSVGYQTEAIFSQV